MKILMTFGDEEHELPLNSKEDFEEAINTFPQLRESMHRDYHDLRSVARDMARYLGEHHINARVED